MPFNRQPLERRKSKRYKPRDGAFAVLRPNTNATKIGNIIDISMSGMAFYCVDSQESETKTDDFNMDIFMSGSGFMVDHIPFRIISEIVVPKEIPFYSVVTRRLGVEFDTMPPRKRSMLEHFLRKHTRDENPPDTPA
ncbi:MAG: PilZ domain-containing protein [Thermodesulfobacteriota bacterium]